MFSKKSLIKSMSVLSGSIFVSRILGFFRDILVAKVFGTGGIIQAYFVAFKLPNILRDLLGEGASNSVFIPVFSDYLVKSDKKEFWKFVNTTLVLVLTVSIILVCLGIAFSPFIIRIIAPGFTNDAEILDLTIRLTRIIFPYLIFLVVTAFMMGVLNTFKVFVPSAISPAIFNIVLIIAVFFAKNSLSGIYIMIAAIFISALLQVGIHLPFMARQGFTVKPFIFYKNIFAHPGVKKIGKLLIPRLASSAIYDLNVLIDTIFASLKVLVGEGAIAAIYYANRMIQFPLGIFGVSISNVSLPTLSEFVAKKEMDKFANTVEFSLNTIFFIMLPSSLGLLVLSEPVIKTIFQRGEFTYYSTIITSSALAFYSIGLCAFSSNRFFSCCFFAMHDTLTPLKITSLALILNAILNFVFIVFFKMRIAGLALASSISATISSIYLFILLKRRVTQINIQAIFQQLLMMLIASTVMGLVIFYSKNNLIKYFNSTVALLLTILLGGVVYFIISLCMGVKQTKRIWQLILKRK